MPSDFIYIIGFFVVLGWLLFSLICLFEELRNILKEHRKNCRKKDL